MAETILDPAVTVAAATAAGFRRRPNARLPEDETAPALETLPSIGSASAPHEATPPPLPESAPPEAFTASLLASRLTLQAGAIAERRPEGWAPPGSELHLTDREV